MKKVLFEFVEIIVIAFILTFIATIAELFFNSSTIECFLVCYLAVYIQRDLKKR